MGLLITACGDSANKSTVINAMDYLVPNQTIAKLHKEYSETTDSTILQGFTTFRYTKVGDTIRETIDEDGVNNYTIYQKLNHTIEIKDYENNILVKTNSRAAQYDINDVFFTEVDEEEDSVSCSYAEKLVSFATDYKIFSDVIKLTCAINSVHQFDLYMAKNMGLIYSQATKDKTTYKASYIGQPQVSLKSLAKFHTTYARSVAVADKGKTVFVGNTDGLVALDASNIDNLSLLSSINAGNFAQITLSKDENRLYAIDRGNFLMIDVSNRNELQIISAMPMRGADRFSLSEDETIAIIQDLDVTRVVDVRNQSKLVTLFDLKSGKSALSNDGKTLFYISPDSPKDLAIYDISDPNDPFIRAVHRDLPYSYPELLLSHSGKELFVSEQQNITIFNVANLQNISQLSRYTGGRADDMQSKLSLSDDDKTLFIRAEEILQLLDLSDLTNIHTLAARSYDFWDIGGIASANNKLFIADGTNGLQIVDNTP